MLQSEPAIIDEAQDIDDFCIEKEKSENTTKRQESSNQFQVPVSIKVS